MFVDREREWSLPDRTSDTVFSTAFKACKSSIHNNFLNELERGPMPNVMVALPNIGGALCSTPQSLADTHYYAV